MITFKKIYSNNFAFNKFYIEQLAAFYINKTDVAVAEYARRKNGIAPSAFHKIASIKGAVCKRIIE